MGIDQPEGRPWVLLPGTLCTGAVFSALLEALNVPTNAQTVVELCHPNIEDYLNNLTDVITPNTIVCGFSLGAIVAAHLADRLNAAQIVLFALNPHADDPAKREGRLALANDVDIAGGMSALADRLPPLAGPKPDFARAHVLSMAGQAQHLIDPQTQLALHRPGALAALAKARCPVTLLTGTQDQQAPLSLAQEAAGTAPDGRAIALDGLGHYALIENPSACARALASAWTC